MVASIQMFLAQWILDMACILHYYYCGHLLSIITIYDPEETCCYAGPASVIIDNNIGLKCWSCRGRTPSCHCQAFFTDYANTTTFAWILDVWQLQNGLNKNFRHEYYCQSSQNLCDHIFNCLQIKGWFRMRGLQFAYKFELIFNLSTLQTL